MTLKTIRSTVVRALAAGAMIAGVTAIVSGTANASAPFTYYASPTGSSANTPCTSKGNPCDLQTALTVEAANSGGVAGSEVLLLKGTYNTRISTGTTQTNTPSQPSGKLVTTNNNAIISGVSAKKTIINGTAPSGANTDNGIIDLTGTTGITIQKLTVEGGGGFPNNTGGNLPQAIMSQPTGTATISGVTIENDAPAAVGITMASGTTNSNQNTLTSGSSCQETTGNSPSVANPWTYPGFVATSKKLTKCAGKSGNVLTVVTPSNTTTYTGSPAWSKTGKKQIEINVGDSPAGTQPAIPAGSTLIFTQASGAYTVAGESCAAVCHISAGSITGNAEAVAVGNGPVGISASDGATLTVDGTSVSGNVNSDFQLEKTDGSGYQDPNAGPGAGIAAGCDPTTGSSPVAVTLNATTSGDDLGVFEESALGVAQQEGGPCATSPSNATSFNIIGGTYAGNSAGVVLAANLTPSIASGFGTTGVTDSITNASISGTTTGAGLELKGTSGQTFGASGAANTNTFSNNGVGYAIGSGATGDTLNNATVSGNLAFGIEDAGTDAPMEFQPGTNGTSNVVTNVAFSTNGSNAGEVNGANIADFTGYNGPTSATLGANCALKTTSTISSVPSGSLTLKNTGSGSCTVANGQPLIIGSLGVTPGNELGGLQVTEYVNNGVGISHVVASGNSFTFTVAPIQVLSLGADPFAPLPSNTAVTSKPAADASATGFALLSGNSTDNTANAGADQCSAPLAAGTAGLNLTNVTASDYYAC